jgi:23S rRNA (guanosine2251-2'-O)-methyltransferase
MKKIMTYGLHAVQALLERRPGDIVRLLVQKNAHHQTIIQIAERASQLGISVAWVLKPTLDQLSDHGHHQGIVAESVSARALNENDLQTILQKESGHAFFLILDGVQDPHNLGACLRSADALGVHAIIIPKDKSVGLTPTVSKVASGAALTVPLIQVTNLARVLRDLKEAGMWIYGAAEEASQSLFQAKFHGSVAIVLGAEGSGLRRLTREHCDELLAIPMLGSVGSLNVSVAAGIFLYEVAKQRATIKINK